MTSKKFHEPDNWKFRHFKSKSGAVIRYGSASPKGESRGTVIITGGYGRHIEYYFEKINNWLDRGYTVHAMDWDGQGGSSREHRDKRHRPSTREFEHHVEILHEFVTTIAKPARNKPAFLSSHSKGGNIVLRYLHKHEGDADFPFTGAILGTPLIDLKTYGLPREAFRRAVNFLDRMGLTHVPLPSIPRIIEDFADAVLGRSQTARDIEREKIHENYKDQTEDYEIGYPTVGWLREALKSCDKVGDETFLRAIETPVLFLTAASDGLVSVAAQKRAAHLMPNGRQIILQEARHGIWYDRDDIQKVLWSEIDHFITRQARDFVKNHGTLLHIQNRLQYIFGR